MVTSLWMERSRSMISNITPYHVTASCWHYPQSAQNVAMKPVWDLTPPRATQNNDVTLCPLTHIFIDLRLLSLWPLFWSRLSITANKLSVTRNTGRCLWGRPLVGHHLNQHFLDTQLRAQRERPGIYWITGSKHVHIGSRETRSRTQGQALIARYLHSMQ